MLLPAQPAGPSVRVRCSPRLACIMKVRSIQTTAALVMVAAICLAVVIAPYLHPSNPLPGSRNRAIIHAILEALITNEMRTNRLVSDLRNPSSYLTTDQIEE